MYKCSTTKVTLVEKQRVAVQDGEKSHDETNSQINIKRNIQINVRRATVGRVLKIVANWEQLRQQQRQQHNSHKNINKYKIKSHKNCGLNIIE